MGRYFNLWSKMMDPSCDCNLLPNYGWLTLSEENDDFESKFLLEILLFIQQS